MRQSRNINIIVDAGGNRLVLINDILFKGKSRRNQKEKIISLWDGKVFPPESGLPEKQN